jgi:hypothetical protein
MGIRLCNPGLCSVHNYIEILHRQVSNPYAKQSTQVGEIFYANIFLSCIFHAIPTEILLREKKPEAKK